MSECRLKFTRFLILEKFAGNSSNTIWMFVHLLYKVQLFHKNQTGLLCRLQLAVFYLLSEAVGWFCKHLKYVNEVYAREQLTGYISEVIR